MKEQLSYEYLDLFSFIRSIFKQVYNITLKNQTSHGMSVHEQKILWNEVIQKSWKFMIMCISKTQRRKHCSDNNFFSVEIITTRLYYYIFWVIGGFLRGEIVHFRLY